MLYHDHAQSLYTSCSACIGVLRKNTETDILVYGGNWVKPEKKVKARSHRAKAKIFFVVCRLFFDLLLLFFDLFRFRSRFRLV